MSISLATKYRPQTFESVCGQSSIIKILERQLELNDIKHCYLFSGPSGCGKTTLARIFANKINQGLGQPIEVDGASNNGVDNVRMITEDAKQRSLDSKYKVFIIDECHAISNAGWQAFLKCIEEPPAYTIFMFCTTDAQKIPQTIQNRVMKFNLTKINTDLIRERLNEICDREGFTNYQESTDYISKISQGGMRDAISLLEKAASYNTELNIDNVLTSLGSFSYTSFFNLTNYLLDYILIEKTDAREDCEKKIVNLVDSYYNSGFDLKIFIDQYLEFVLDLDKYCLFKDMSVVKIPSSMEKKVRFTTGVDEPSMGNVGKYFNWLVDKILDIKMNIKYDSNVKTTVTIMLLNICRNYYKWW